MVRAPYFSPRLKTDIADGQVDRHPRRRPFASWMKRLANLKNSHGDSSRHGFSHRRANDHTIVNSNGPNMAKNNPYPLSSRIESTHPARLSCSPPVSSRRSQRSSLSQSKHSISTSHDSQGPSKSRAPTLATTAETTVSEAAHSGAGTSATAAKTDGDRNSTFSSPAPSERSLTTTLTTMQSGGPPLNLPNNSNQGSALSAGASHQALYSSSQPATAVPAHLAPPAHPTTYHSAIANNLLTDDASIVTLASSSKRRRRNSLDTNASVRALAPASLFGGSRESLPLSVLSGTIIHPTADNMSLRESSGALHRPGLTGAERASLISTSGVTAPALASERNSYIGTASAKYGGDGASVRSGLLGAHGRNDSLSGSIGGHREPQMVTAPTSPSAEGTTPVTYMATIYPGTCDKFGRRSSELLEEADHELNEKTS